MPINNRVGLSLIKDALPTDTQVNTRDWANLLARANELGHLARFGRGDSYVDSNEANNIATLIANGGQRLYPAEQELSPLLSTILAEHDSSDFISVPAGDVSKPGATQSFPESVPVASINDWQLRPIAERLARTRPGNEDGDTDNLRYTDLDAMPETLTPSERSRIDEIRRKYFRGTVDLDWSTKTIEVPAHDNPSTQVRVVLERVKTASAVTVRDGDPTVTGQVRDRQLVLHAPAGARIIWQYQPSSERSREVSGVGITETLENGTATIRAGGREPMDYHIMIVRDADGQGPGLPTVLDSLRLTLPGMAALG